jgi:hypothetical protein
MFTIPADGLYYVRIDNDYFLTECRLTIVAAEDPA